MLNFSKFIAEQGEMRFINPNHGNTIFTLKVGPKHSYLYNSNHKNPTRVFTNMNAAEISNILREQGFKHA